MKISLACFISLALATVLLVAIGQSPTEARWGAEGVSSLRAVAAICLSAAVAGLLPLAVVATKWPSYVGQAALCGTAIRLMLTMAVGAAYQTLAKPHLPSFLFWAVVIYCVLLAIETGFGVYLTRCSFPVVSTKREVPA
ncbi:MAG: hypothetical protein HZA51_14205 [Planctomycetes bacterium]|nr:hypothetical protein [Planctomycetota bacterium]